MNQRTLAAVALIVAASVFSGYAVYAFGFWEADSSEIKYTEIQSIESITIEYVDGTEGAYKYYSNSAGENTIRFTQLSEDSEYTITGTLKGNIEIDVGSDKSLKLNFTDLTIGSNYLTPISVTSCDELNIDATNTNKIGDMRWDLEAAFAIETSGDLMLSGDGSISIHSTHNSGMKAGDLITSISSLDVDCVADAFSVTSMEIASGTLNITSHQESGIVSAQEVDVTGDPTVTIRSAKNGIKSGTDVNIDGNASITIQTADMAPRTDVDAVYVGYANDQFTFSLKAKDANGKEVWINPSGDPNQVYNRMAKSYVYTFKVPMDYRSITIYAYDYKQIQGQDSDYTAKSEEIMTGFDTNSFLVTQCIKFAPIKYRQMNFNGPESPDFDRLPTAGIDARENISVNGATLMIDSHGDSLHAGMNITVEDSAITAFCRNDTIACNELVLRDTDSVLISTGAMGSSINAKSGYEFDSGRTFAVCGNNEQSAKNMQNCDDYEDIATAKTFSGIGSGSYLQTNVDGTVEVAISMPDNDSGFPHPEKPPMLSAPADAGDPAALMNDKPMPKEVLVTYLGSASAEITNPSTIDVDLDDNGIYWK